ncbi:histidine kinase [Cloacibacillus evryensis]|uniref:histidine kinase n=1 Tax=Cloacibacillus evryensis TaxID=508460 RepID=UPI000240DE31|nr:hypothetical protein [Cloacibacillus evryensis]EHL71182.1 hypothetical protein HMPREF1006_02073 [Synergistes sp. 3_1_syn1]
MEELKRPSPEELLSRLKDQREKEEGTLKIFFGYAAGVGKTYAMLEAARRAKSQGIDVAVGYIEPHTRPETMALLEGLETLPVRSVGYRGLKLDEFDLDGALARHPKLILVDELAHTNAPGSRHVKRYQDIKELLRAGIDVYTTVNVQHIESLNDIVASITGVTVAERVPDDVFDRAELIEVIDLEPDDLIERIESGKVYKNERAKRALGGFFTKKTSAPCARSRCAAPPTSRAGRRWRRAAASMPASMCSPVSPPPPPTRRSSGRRRVSRRPFTAASRRSTWKPGAAGRETAADGGSK